MPPPYRQLPNTSFRPGPSFDQSPLGMKALQQRGQMQTRQANPTPGVASFYGDTSVGQTQGAGNIGLQQRVHQGSPTANSEMKQYGEGLMKPFSQDQADSLQGESAMPGFGLAMGRANAQAHQMHANFLTQAADALHQTGQQAIQQQVAAGGQHPGMLPNPDISARKTPPFIPGQPGGVGVSIGAPTSIGQEGAGISSAFPGASLNPNFTTRHSFGEMSASPIVDTARIRDPDPRVASSGPTAQMENDALPLDPHVHGLALNPNNAFRVPSWAKGGSGIGVHGMPQVQHPGVAMTGPASALRSAAPTTPGAWTNPYAGTEFEGQANFEHQAEEGKLAHLSAQTKLFEAQAAQERMTPGQKVQIGMLMGGQDPQSALLARMALEAPPVGPGSPVNHGNASQILSMTNPALPGMFAPNEKGELPDLDSGLSRLAGMGVQGYDDPNSQVGQALLRHIQGTYGAGLPDAIAPIPRPSRTLEDMPRLLRQVVGTVGLRGIGTDPMQQYKDRLATRNWMHKMNREPIESMPVGRYSAMDPRVWGTGDFQPRW